MPLTLRQMVGRVVLDNRFESSDRLDNNRPTEVAIAARTLQLSVCHPDHACRNAGGTISVLAA